jgi:hypothetical protein
MHTQGLPTSLAKITEENEMLNCLLRGSLAKEALVARAQLKLTSLEHISCVQPIQQKQPAKELNSGGAF